MTLWKKVASSVIVMTWKMLNFAVVKELSVLIPEYCDDCVAQVSALRSQCDGVAGLRWEIIVADDGSPAASHNANQDINGMAGCRLIMRGKNYGRASTRNFLARQARYHTLLYIDSGLMPNDRFVENYVSNIGKAAVVCGNIEVDSQHADLTNLRCRNELRAQRRFTASLHSAEPYKNFHTGAFMIERSVLLANPFREDIVTYGYEDTLFGKHLCEQGISVAHIDNPVLFVRFEDNACFLDKTREGIATLYCYRHELKGYSPLLAVVEKLRQLRLLGLVYTFYRLFGKAMERNLTGRRPNLTLFSLYRVCLLSEKFLS